MSRPDPQDTPNPSRIPRRPAAPRSTAARDAALDPVAAAALLPPARHDPAAARVLASGLDHPEGVCWDPGRGRVLAGGESGQVYAVDPATGGVEEIGRTTGLLLGVSVDGTGRVVVCASDEGAVRVLDGTAWVTVLDTVDGSPLALPNYAAFAPDATLLVSDSGGWRADNGRIVALRPDGTASTVSRSVPYFTNGLAVSADGAWLYVAESEAARVSRLDLDALLAGDDPVPDTLVELPGTVPDGVVVVDDGSVVVTSYRPDVVHHLALDGSLAVIGHDWQGTVLAGPTNGCFAGPGLDTLVVANLNRWHLTALDTGLRGAPVHRPTRWAPDA